MIHLGPRFFLPSLRAGTLRAFSEAVPPRGPHAPLHHPRSRVDRLRRAAQARGLSALSAGRHARSPRLPPRLRRHQSPAKNRPRPAGLLQQPTPTHRLRTHLQRLDGQQDSTTQSHVLELARVPPACGRGVARGRHPGDERVPKRPDPAADLEALRPRPESPSHRPARTCSAAGVAESARSTTRCRPGSRPSPRRVSRCRLPHRSLPAGDGNVLSVNPPSL